MLLSHYLKRLLQVALLLTPMWAHGDSIDITMSVLQRSQDAYTAFLREQGKSVFDVTSLKSQHTNRNVADMVIIMQALKLGGLSPNLKLVLAPNYARELAMVRSGNVLIMHQDAWDVDFDDAVYKSDALIPKGKFFKGFYIKESSLGKIRIERLEDFQRLSSVSSPRWTVDWDTLSQLNLKALYQTQDKVEMFKLVLLRNVDFTAQEFSQSDDMSYDTEHGRLFPVPGVKLALNASRHLMVSRAHPQGDYVFQAIQKGLRIMHTNGSIERYLSDIRFYRTETKNWKILSVDSR
jgi:hypothetical protein